MLFRSELGAIVEAEGYGAEATWTLAVPVERLAELEGRLADATAGRGKMLLRSDDESQSGEEGWPS